jgi:uncharacterized membrane protein YeiH
MPLVSFIGTSWSSNDVHRGMPLSFLPFAASLAFGGLLCDVICSQPDLIFHSNAEVYALLALARAVMYLFCETIKCIKRIGLT